MHLISCLVTCISTTSHQPRTEIDLNESKAGAKIVSEEEIFPRDLNSPFNLPTKPTSTSDLLGKPNSNGAMMYVGAFQVMAMPMTRPELPLATSFGNNPNVFGNKKE